MKFLYNTKDGIYMCKKHYVTAIKLIIALSIASTVCAMEKKEELTPLHRKIRAIFNDDIETVKALIDDKTLGIEEVLEIHTMSLTPLLFAAMRNSVKSGEHLLSLGANTKPVIAQTDSCVHIAAMNNSVAFLEMLKSKKLSFEEANKEGSTPLCAAIYKDASDSVDFLLNAGVDRKSLPLSDMGIMLPLLHFAAFAGSPKVAQLLVEKYGYSVNDTTFLCIADQKVRFATPNDLAVMGGYWKVCEVLKSKGANPLSHHAFMDLAIFKK